MLYLKKNQMSKYQAKRLSLKFVPYLFVKNIKIYLLDLLTVNKLRKHYFTYMLQLCIKSLKKNLFSEIELHTK